MSDKHLDIYLLRCLSVIVEEAHVTKAAERMGSTQPAMSAVLRRLRTIFNDPLLVRTERGMVPTERARELVDALHPALDTIDRAVSASQAFDPATTRMSFEVGASESASFLLMPALVAHLARIAPGVQLRVRIPDLARARQSLEEAELDLLVSFTRHAPEGLRSSTLWRHRLVVIAARAHPLQGELSLQEFLRWPHAYHRLHGRGSAVEMSVEAALQALGCERTIGVSLPSSIAVPAVVARTHLLATVPQDIARVFAEALALKILRSPVEFDDVQLGMYWHDRMHRNPPHQWLRRVAREVGASLEAAGKRSGGL